MSIVKLNGTGWYWPEPAQIPFPAGVQAFNPGLVIDATGEKVGFVGRVWFPERTGSKSIRRIQLRFATVVKAGGSALTLSLQPVTVTPNPGAPTGVQQQSVAIPNADIVANGWYRTAPLNADRSVALNDRIAVVCEFDGAGRLGADSISIAMVSGTSGYTNNDAYPVQFLASWAVGSGVPLVVLEFTDGTFGTLAGSLPWSAVNVHTYASNTAVADEYALAFTVPMGCITDALVVCARAVSVTADFDVVLYEAATPLYTFSVDGSSLANLAQNFLLLPIPEQRLYPGRQYYLSIRPTTTSTVAAYSNDVADAAFWPLMSGDASCTYATRLDGGAWAANTATRRLQAAVRISAIEVGGGAQMATII